MHGKAQPDGCPSSVD